MVHQHAAPALDEPEEDIVGVESDVRARVLEFGRRLELDSREIIIFIHRKFAIVAYKW
jgi:hypothetical protein